MVVFTAVTAPFTAFCRESITLSDVQSAVEGVISYKCKEENAASFSNLLEKLSLSAGTFAADWYYIAFSQYGLDCNNQKSIEALKSKVDEFYSGDLADVKVTDMQRVAFALSACGEDIANINGHNLLADSTYNRNEVKPLNSQGVNSVAYALLLLDSRNFKVPENAVLTRDKMISLILKAELENGGFSLFGDYPDVDITSIAVQALSPYKNRPDVKAVIDKCIKILSEKQDKTGGYKSFSNEISCETTSQAILCLASCGINPSSDSRFVKNGNSVLDGLMVFRLKSGAFSHFEDGKPDNMATYQALGALVGTYRFMNSIKPFYDFFENPQPFATETVKDTEPAIKTTNSAVRKSGNVPTVSKTTLTTDKPTDKVEFETKRVKKNHKPKQLKKATEPTGITETTIVYNSVSENKQPVEFQKVRSPLYVDFALLSAFYIILAVIRRNK